MIRPLRFEPFEPETGPAVEPGPSADWREGHAQGLADAAASDMRARAAREEAALASLADLQFTWTEARASVLGALAPFFRTLADRLLPELCDDVVAANLAAVLSRAAVGDVPSLPDIMVNPDDAERLGRLLAGSPLPNVRLRQDPTLAPGQVRIGRAGDDTMLDMPEFLAELREIVSAWPTLRDEMKPQEERLHNG